MNVLIKEELQYLLPFNHAYFQSVIIRWSLKHLGVGVLRETAGLATKLLFKGQTNFVRMLFKFKHVFNAERLFADHQKPVKYEMRLPGSPTEVPMLMFFQVPL